MFWLKIFHQLEFMTSCHISPSSFISNAIWDVGFQKRKGNGSENCNVSKLRIHVVCHCINNWNLSIYLRYRSLDTLEIVSWNSIDIDYKSYKSHFSWCNSLSKLKVTQIIEFQHLFVNQLCNILFRIHHFTNQFMQPYIEVLCLPIDIEHWNIVSMVCFLSKVLRQDIN